MDFIWVVSHLQGKKEHRPTQKFFSSEESARKYAKTLFEPDYHQILEDEYGEFYRASIWLNGLNWVDEISVRKFPIEKDQ